MGTELDRAVVRFVADTSKFVRGIADMDDKVKNFGKRLDAIGKRMSSMGTTMMKWGAVIGAPLVYGIKSAMDFEKALAEIQTISGDTDEEMEKLGESIKELSVRFGQDLIVQTNAAYEALSASVPRDNLLSFIEVSSKTAVAGLTNVDVAVDALSTAVNAYGDKLMKGASYTEKATHIADVMFMTVLDGKVRFEELASGIGNVIATAASAGVSIEEVGASIAAMTKQGLSSDEAVTALNQTILGLIKTTPDAEKAFQSYGISLEGFRTGTESFSEVMKQVAEATGGSTTALVELFPNIRALKGALMLASQDASVYTKSLDLMNGSLGSIDKAFSIVAETSAFKFDEAMKAFKVTMVEIGAELLPMVVSALEKATQKIKEFRDWAKENPAVFSSWTIAAAKLAVTLVSLGLTLKVIGGAFSTLGKVIMALPTIVHGLTAAIGALTAISLPWLVVIGAIVALLAALAVGYYNVKKAQEEYEQKQQQLSKGIDEYIKKLQEKNQITAEEAASVRSAADADDKYAKAMEVTVTALSNKHEQWRAEIAATIEAERGAAATRQEIMLAEETRIRYMLDNKIAASAIALQLSKDELAELAKLPAQEQELYLQRIRTAQEFQSTRGMIQDLSVNDLRLYTEALVGQAMTEEQIEMARTIALQRELDMRTAAQAVILGLNDAHLAKLQEGYTIERLLREQHINEMAVAAQEETAILEFQSQNWEQYRELLRETLGNVAEQIRILKEEIVSHAKLTGEWRQEDIGALKHLEEVYREVYTELSEIDKLRVEAELENVAIKADVDRQKIDSTLQAAEAQQEADAKALKAQQEFKQEVLNLAPTVAKAYNQMATEQQSAMDAYIFSLQQAGKSTAEVADTIYKDLHKLSMEHRESPSPLDSALYGYEMYIQATSNTMGSVSNILGGIRGTLMEFGNAHWMISGVVQNALNSVINIWDGFKQRVMGIIDTIRNAMQLLDPRVRRSPSIIDRVTDGMLLMKKVYREHAEKIAETFLKTHRRIVDMMNQGEIKVHLVKDASGNVNWGQSRLIQAPEGFTMADYMKYYNTALRIAELMSGGKGKPGAPTSDFDALLAMLLAREKKSTAEKDEQLIAFDSLSTSIDDLSGNIELEQKTLEELPGSIASALDASDKAGMRAWGPTVEPVIPEPESEEISRRGPLMETEQAMPPTYLQTLLDKIVVPVADAFWRGHPLAMTAPYQELMLPPTIPASDYEAGRGARANGEEEEPRFTTNIQVESIPDRETLERLVSRIITEQRYASFRLKG